MVKCISIPQKSFQPYPDLKNSPSGPQKRQKDLKIKSKLKVRIEEIIGNKSWSTTSVVPETLFEPYSIPKINPLAPQEIKKTQN